MKKIGTIVVNNENIDIKLSNYKAGNIAIVLECEDGEPYATFSCNLAEQASSLAPNEFFAKTYNENESLVAPMLNSGLFTDTGKRVSTGFVEAPLWTLKSLPA